MNWSAIGLITLVAAVVLIPMLLNFGTREESPQPEGYAQIPLLEYRFIAGLPDIITSADNDAYISMMDGWNYRPVELWLEPGDPRLIPWPVLYRRLSWSAQQAYANVAPTEAELAAARLHPAFHAWYTKGSAPTANAQLAQA